MNMGTHFKGIAKIMKFSSAQTYLLIRKEENKNLILFEGKSLVFMTTLLPPLFRYVEANLCYTMSPERKRGAMPPQNQAVKNRQCSEELPIE